MAEPSGRFPRVVCKQRRHVLRDRRRSRPSVPASRLGLVLVWTLASCGQSYTNNYGAAAVALGATVLTTGIYRAATGACWANCAKGWYCDHRSGTCMRGECDPGCREGDYCVREANGRFRCVASTDAFAIGRAAPDAGATATAVSTDAGTDVPTASTEQANGASILQDAAPCGDGSTEAGAGPGCGDADSD